MRIGLKWRIKLSIKVRNGSSKKKSGSDKTQQMKHSNVYFWLIYIAIIIITENIIALCTSSL